MNIFADPSNENEQKEIIDQSTKILELLFKSDNMTIGIALQSILTSLVGTLSMYNEEVKKDVKKKMLDKEMDIKENEQEFETVIGRHRVSQLTSIIAMILNNEDEVIKSATLKTAVMEAMLDCRKRNAMKEPGIIVD